MSKRYLDVFVYEVFNCSVEMLITQKSQLITSHSSLKTPLKNRRQINRLVDQVQFQSKTNFSSVLIENIV